MLLIFNFFNYNILIVQSFSFKILFVGDGWKASLYQIHAALMNNILHNDSLQQVLESATIGKVGSKEKKGSFSCSQYSYFIGGRTSWLSPNIIDFPILREQFPKLL